MAFGGGCTVFGVSTEAQEMVFKGSGQDGSSADLTPTRAFLLVQVFPFSFWGGVSICPHFVKGCFPVIPVGCP